MWHTGQDWYFSVGESGLRVIELALRMSLLPEVTSILDLPCGHGRVGRFLRAAFPKAKMYFCDLDRSGVDFCVKTFGGIGVQSQLELTDVVLPTVDVIWVGSLFTHVDISRTQRWLIYLANHLNPYGVLVATFHGQWSVEFQKKHPMIDVESWNAILNSYKNTGFGYAPYRITRTKRWLIYLAKNLKSYKNTGFGYTPYRELDMGDYGISLTRPGVVCDLVSAIPGVRLAGYMERGWADNHDVVIITRNDRLRG
jgi:SAM-dependent methyltransferase